MHKRVANLLTVLFLYVIPLGVVEAGAGQADSPETTGTLRGKVTLKTKGTPIHNAAVIIVELGRTAETDNSGGYEFQQVPPGSYDVVTSLPGLSSEMQTVEIVDGATATLDFELSIVALKYEITVTTSGRPQSTFESFQTVNTLDSFDLAEKMATSIGEIVENQPGVAKRSFGPGASRPVIRGFDGDRVLVLQDGIRTGSLASQSGDHGEPVDALSLERLEVVKGPATLLYGSNAVGGVVNAVSRHQQIHADPHEGLRAYVSGVGGSNNGHAGGSAGFEYGVKKWLMWGGGGSQRTGDYGSPDGEVENSKTRISNTSLGVGWYGHKAFASVGYKFEDGRYGVPFAAELEAGEREGEFGEGEKELIDLDFRRQNLRFTGGFRNLNSFFDQFRLSLDLTDWNHKELENDEVSTVFDNRQFVYRGMFEQKRTRVLSGRFGFWGLLRDYDVLGEEALSPPVDKKNLALFGLEELDFERVKLQLGGRLEHSNYEPIELVERSFTGFSGAAGVRVPLWKSGAFVTNFTHSYRAPALEELYNNGPHLGNLAFEIGNPSLQRELSNGVDLSLRHSGSRLRAEATFFYYDIDDFVFLAPTGEIKDGLIAAKYLQADSRYVGAEIDLDIGLHSTLWLKLGLDAVDAQLTDSGTPLPRIPPVRGRVGFLVRHKNVSLKPEVIVAAAQEDLFPTETRTAGYTVMNLTASYILPQQHYVHQFSFNVFNIGDRLYRNHVSFIKDLAPEIGRGVRFIYTVRFF